MALAPVGAWFFCKNATPTLAVGAGAWMLAYAHECRGAAGSEVEPTQEFLAARLRRSVHFSGSNVGRCAAPRIDCGLEPRMIGTPDLEAAISEVKPSLNAWFDTARNVALFANEGGTYDDLAAYLRKRRLI